MNDSLESSEEKHKSWCKWLGDLISEYRITIYILAGVLLMVPKLILDLKLMELFSKELTDFLATISTAVLASGIFASVSKSSFFKNIYEAVLIDVLYGDQYLSKASEQSPARLMDMWKRVSSAVYRYKFPYISGKIQSIY